MKRWAGLLLAGLLLLAFGIGLVIEPNDSRANLTTATWHASYFDNIYLTGDPVVTRYERTVNYNWSEEAPLGVPPDGFSARWIGRFEFETGTWRFVVGADDGIRMWIDDQLIIDQWEPVGQFATYSADHMLDTGEHTIKIEYYDLAGLAGINVRWDSAPLPVTVDNTQNQNGERNGDSATASNILGHVATSSLDIYDGPGVQYLRIGQVYLYQTFPILSKNRDGSWYQISLKDGRTGWVSSAFMFRNPGELPISAMPVAQTVVHEPARTLTPLIFRNGPSADHTMIDTLPDDTEVTVLGRSSNSMWYLVERDRVEGWLFAPGVKLLNSLAVDIPVIQ